MLASSDQTRPQNAQTMTSLSERAKRRRSSLFFGASLSMLSIKSPALPTSPLEQPSYPNLKHEVRQISSKKEPNVSKSSLYEPLFQDSYLCQYVSSADGSSEDESSSAVDQQEPESPTFSDFQFNIGGTDEKEIDNVEEKEDVLEDFGLGFAVETYKPNDVARRVSIIVCKPKVVDITPPLSPIFTRATSSSSSDRQSFVQASSRPASAHFGGWYNFYDPQNTDFSGTPKSSSEQIYHSSSSSISDISKSTDATSVSMSSVDCYQTPMPAAPLPQRANALKRQSYRLSSSFSRSFLAKAADEGAQSPVSPVSPAETFRPMTPRPMTPKPFIAKAPHDRMPSLQIPPNFPSVNTMPPPPFPPQVEVARSPALRKKKSLADAWFKRRSVSTYL